MADSKVSLQLRLEPDVRDMIKNDAKALGMTPAAYVSMVCKLVNDSTRQLASEEFAQNLTRAVLQVHGK